MLNLGTEIPFVKIIVEIIVERYYEISKFKKHFGI